MATHYAFFYFMKQDLPNVPKLIPDHINYWGKNKPCDHTGGPFGDHSGGLILFKVDNMESTKELVSNDPFITGDVIEKNWIK